MNIFLLVLTVLFLVLVFSAYRSLRYYFRAKRPPVVVFPQDFGLTREDVLIPVPGRGVIYGWFIANSSSTKTIVFAHGFAMNKGEILKRTYTLAPYYNLFYFDFLGAGESQGRTHVGYSEPEDISAVIHYLKEHKPQTTQKIALYGISQGAGASVRYAAEHQDIACLILEAVYFSFKDIAKRWIWKRKKTPYFPSVYGYLLFKEIKLRCKLDSLSPRHMAAKVSIPTLLIHGGNDTISPLANAQKVYDLLSGPKELWVVKQAGHTSCSKEAGGAYPDKIRSFLESYF